MSLFFISNYPYDKHHEGFGVFNVSAISANLCDLDSSALLVYFRISRGIDTKIQECFEQTYSEKVIPIFNEVIEQYPAYFKYYSERENSAI